MNESETRINSPPPIKEKAAEEGSVVEGEKENQTPEAVISIDDDANINPTSIKSKTQSELSISSKTSLDEKPKNSPARKPRRTKAEMEKEKKEKEEQRKRKAEELAKKKAEKEREKEEKRKAKELADQERAEKKRLENEEKQRKAAEREKIRLEKEEKEKQAREEREKKQKEKDEAKRKKEDLEKRRLEEKEKERLLIEEREEKARQQRAKFFQSFSKKRLSTKIEKIEDEPRWTPFVAHKEQFLCPVIYRQWSESEEDDFEKFLKLLREKGFSCEESKYFHELKNRPFRRRPKRERRKKTDDECFLINPELEQALKEGARFKYFNFHTDYRPPFYGTNRSTSTEINPRRPLALDPNLDYEYDSGEDWEEEPEGEDVESGNEKMSDEEEMDEDDQDGFFVPHGYLSDDEENAACDPDDPEDRRPKLTEKELQEREERFQKMRKRRLRKLIAFTEGPIYSDEEDDDKPQLENMSYDQKTKEFDWEEVICLREGSPDPLRDYSDNEIGSLDGIWNEIASSEEECDIENVELDEDEEEDLVELEDQFPSDEEDFVELENPMWDNSAMRNWSDFDEVKEQLLKREEEYAAPEDDAMEVEKTQKSEDQLFCTESPEKTRMRRKIWAHPSGASVSCARATTYLDVCDLNMILKDGKITIAPGIEPEASESEEVEEFMENEDSEHEEEQEVEEDGGEIQGEVIEILSSDGEGDSEGHESEEIPDTEDEQEVEQPEAVSEVDEDDDDLDNVEDDEDDEESLGDEDSDEDEEELEDPEEHDSIPCGGNFDDEQENNKLGEKRKVSPARRQLNFEDPKNNDEAPQKEPVAPIVIDSDSNPPAPIEETPKEEKVNILIPKKKKKKDKS
ncbi:Oidioi.mRNA.OKI2018_I69.chr1.g3344.t1.cds [Oikopleura dioica]|uniref:Oidioi.mRNA.OKI2018_I69.chr1.g3344.t1.cds n=1 Tax=Oikopleura dioica TaxID=34765 RepID=A0ABN7SZ74_OIKDI|nr:Oidioi.mRNA.OKI2018_I69.chr1.g3344.t1.cds [Oikopleura dioica]